MWILPRSHQEMRERRKQAETCYSVAALWWVTRDDTLGRQSERHDQSRPKQAPTWPRWGSPVSHGTRFLPLVQCILRARVNRVCSDFGSGRSSIHRGLVMSDLRPSTPYSVLPMYLLATCRRGAVCLSSSDLSGVATLLIRPRSSSTQCESFNVVARNLSC